MSYLSRLTGPFFRLVLDNLQRFVVGALCCGGAYLLVLGLAAYFLLGQDPSWRFTTAMVLVGIGAVLVGLVSGARLAATETLRDWVDSTGAGPMLAKVVFKQALGVSDKRPHGSKQFAESLQGATVGQAKAKLTEALSDMFHSDALDRWLPSQGRWVAKKLTSTAGWVVVRSLVERVPGAAEDHAELDLLALRDSVADGLTDKAVGLVLGRATWLSWAATLAAGAICLLALFVLRYAG